MREPWPIYDLRDPMPCQLAGIAPLPGLKGLCVARAAELENELARELRRMG